MAADKTRALGLALGIGSAVLALRPFGPVGAVEDVMTLPARVAAPLGLPTRLVSSLRGADAAGGDALALAEESALSGRLERAVLRSAWPTSRDIAAGVEPIPGEVEARRGRSRDIIRVRVAEPERVAVGQPVVAGDVYVGRVARVPFREASPDRPGLVARLLRLLRLSSPPVPPPRDAVDVALITGSKERVGGHVVQDQDGRSCDMVVGGLAPRDDRVWLAVHTPESRATRAGRVIVKEPRGLLDRADSLAEGFVLGDLVAETVQDEGLPFARTVLGVRPLVDFASGLNQVLVLAESSGAGRTAVDAPPVRVLEDGGWLATRALAIGDTRPWRSVLRLDRGKRSGVRTGAAVVDGVRLLGRVARADQLTSAVTTLADPGFRVSALAQSTGDPDGAPLALGTLESLGRGPGGEIILRWSPDPGVRFPGWLGSEPEEVILWTGSGMLRVPRGLRLGRAVIRVAEGEHLLELRGTASARGQLAVRTGGARVARSEGGVER